MENIITIITIYDLIVSNQMFDKLTRYFYTEIKLLRKVKSENYEEELLYNKANNRTKRIVNVAEEIYNDIQNI